MKASLGIVTLLIAVLIGLVVLYFIVYEIAEDEPQYLYLPETTAQVRGWVAATILGLLDLALIVLGVRLLRRQR